ncbi:MAG: DUF2169 domain-containing protein [Polyangiaceae bacterium]|nr:DUF2169 domain-containing protein [Polyangiaceae bacterium]
MESPPLDNKTGFAAHPQVLLDKDGEKLAVIVKATFEAPHDGSGPLELAPAARRRGIRLADVPWDPKKPEKSSSMYPADLCLRKPGTDVIVVATAYAPEGKPVPQFDAAVRVGSLHKVVRVFGLRVWEHRGAGLSAPLNVESAPLRYENAWGGLDDSGDTIVEEPRNPVGTGIAADSAALTHRPAPSIEDPYHPIVNAKTRPPPAGVGPIGPGWEPRRKYAGTYDELWLDYRAPLPPLDFDDRFNQSASSGLTSTPPLTGMEQIALMNLVPGGGPRVLAMPGVGIEVVFRVKGREHEIVHPPLDTVIVDVFGIGPDWPIAVELVWRAHIRAPRHMKDAKISVYEVKGP